MISRNGNGSWFAAHYEWLALAVGILALAGGAAFYVMSSGSDPDEAAASAVANVDRMKPAETGVKALDMADLQSATSVIRKPVLLADVPEKTESFLASERRVLCKKCKKAISGDIRACPQCPFCGEKQEEEQKVVLDADNDGMADEWEKRFGLNAGDPADANADADGDGFTNLEEYEAKTDPTDRNDHPDYLDSLKIVLPLKETYLPFVFTAANKIPAGWRCEFFDAKQKDDYGRMGRTITAIIGEEIGKGTKNPTGYVLKSYEKKEAKHERKGMKGMFVTVDVSEVKVERKSDGKVLTLVIGSKKAKPVAVDVQATLVYERGGSKNLDVVSGSEISLNGVKYRIVSIETVGKGAKVTVANSLTGKKRTLEALEQ